MSVVVNLAGVNYTIPETGETGWGEEVTNYLVALSNALLGNDIKFKTRIVTVTPSAVLGDDVVVIWNGAASSATLNLPTGVLNKVYIISNNSATTETLNVVAAGTEQIGTSTTYTIRDRNGFLMIVFNGTSWTIMSESRSNIRSSVYFNNSLFVNNSFIESSTNRAVNPSNANHLESCSADFVGSDFMQFSVSINDGSNRRGFLCTAEYDSNLITCLSDSYNLFLTADAGTGVFVWKTLMSNTINFKSRLGVPASIEIKALTNRLTNITAWS